MDSCARIRDTAHLMGVLTWRSLCVRVCVCASVRVGGAARNPVPSWLACSQRVSACRAGLTLHPVACEPRMA